MTEDDSTARKTRTWVVVIVLIVGTVVAAGIWLATVGSPATYEPFVVEYADEEKLDNGEWESITDFPYVHEKDPIDLTYGTFHEYIRIEHTGEKPVNVSVEIGPDNDENNDLFRFVLIEDFVEPQRVSWDENRSVAIVNEENYTAETGEYEEEFRLEEDDKEFTLINIYQQNEEPETMDVDGNDVNVVWNFQRHTVEIYNFTPIILIISIIVAGTIGYSLFKYLKGGEIDG